MQTALFWVQAIGTIAIAATFVIYLLQWLEMRNASRAQNILSALQYIQDPATRKARKHVLTILKDKDVSDWNDVDQDAVSTVSSTYDILSILVRTKLVPVHLVIENWGPSIRLCFPICEPWIAVMRENAGPKYWDDYEWLFNETKKVTFEQQLKKA